MPATDLRVTFTKLCVYFYPIGYILQHLLFCSPPSSVSLHLQHPRSARLHQERPSLLSSQPLLFQLLLVLCCTSLSALPRFESCRVLYLHLLLLLNNSTENSIRGEKERMITGQTVITVGRCGSCRSLKADQFECDSSWYVIAHLFYFRGWHQ